MGALGSGENGSQEWMEGRRDGFERFGMVMKFACDSVCVSKVLSVFIIPPPLLLLPFVRSFVCPNLVRFPFVMVGCLGGESCKRQE